MTTLVTFLEDLIVSATTRNPYDWTVRLPAIAAAALRIKAKSFTIDGEAVALKL
jgi:ATP-dependent DNA ligase